jgi:hypothetical protein
MTANLQNTVILGLMPQVMFFAAVSIAPLPLPWFYTILFLLLVAQCAFFFFDNGRLPFSSKQFKAGELPPQIAMGTLIGVAITAPLALVASFRVGPTFAQDFMVQVVFVGFVETFDLIVTVRTIPHGEVVWPFKFALEHWYVREAIGSGDVAVAALAIAYTALFGVLFYVLFAAREAHGAWFGAVTSWSAHVAVNLMLVLFPLTLFGFEFLPLTAGSGGSWLAGTVLAVVVMEAVVAALLARQKRG